MIGHKNIVFIFFDKLFAFRFYPQKNQYKEDFGPNPVDFPSVFFESGNPNEDEQKRKKQKKPDAKNQKNIKGVNSSDQNHAFL